MGTARSPDPDGLFRRCLQRMQAEGPSALEALCAQHPDQAEALRARVRSHAAAGRPEAASPAPWPETLGDFRLLGRLGAGGMGEVHLAEQGSLGRRVALKLVRPERLYFPGTRERFRGEVEAVARLAHPAIVPVHAFGEERGVPYLAMELVPGAALDELLERLAGRARVDGRALLEVVEPPARERGFRGAADPSQPPFALAWSDACLWIAREVAQALEHAHQRGIAHGDVKPSNVMLTPAGRVQLIDFGLARALASPGGPVEGGRTGSLPYMAPELLRGEPPDARADVYGLGITLHELLARAPAFTADTPSAMCARIESGARARLRGAAPGVSRDVEALVATAAEPVRERRYASAADLAGDLTAALERRPLRARRAGPWLHALRWARREPAATAAILLAAAAACGGPAAFGLQQRRAAAGQRALNERIRAENLRAEAHLGRALEAVDVLLARVAAADGVRSPRFEALRRDLLDQALRFRQRLARDAGAGALPDQPSAAPRDGPDRFPGGGR